MGSDGTASSGGPAASPTPPRPVLSVTGLAKAFGGRAILDGLTFSVDAGEAVALSGPNGSGKTTVLRCVIGSEPVDAGQIALAGRPLRDTDPGVRAALCAVVDDMGWFPDVTVLEHLDVLARGNGTDDADDRVDAAIEALGLDDVADQVPLTLSSGQRRRLSLATSLVRDFDLLVLDEPEQRLDTAGRAWLAAYLIGVQQRGGAVLLASHDHELLDRIGARRIVLDPDLPIGLTEPTDHDD